MSEKRDNPDYTTWLANNRNNLGYTTWLANNRNKTKEAFEAVKRLAVEANKSNAQSIWGVMLENSLPFFLGSLFTFFSFVVTLCIML